MEKELEEEEGKLRVTRQLLLANWGRGDSQTIRGKSFYSLVVLALLVSPPYPSDIDGKPTGSR